MRETRHLWIGNLAENTREESIAEHFKRYGKIDKVRLLPKRGSDVNLSACVAFVDIRSAQKAKGTPNMIGDRELVTDYYDPTTRAGPPGSSQTSRANDEGQRRSQQASVTGGRTNGPAHGNRRYEAHRDSGAADDRDRPSSYDKHYQQGSADDRPDNYDSDRSKGRLEAADREKSHSRSSNRSHELPSKKHKADALPSKRSKKRAKNNGEDARTKGGVTKKVKAKRAKERGRSPTIKRKKSASHGPTTHSPAGSSAGVSGKRGLKTSPSSSNGRSSSSGSGSASTSRSGRTSSNSTSASSTSTNSSKSRTTNSPGSESSYETEEGRKLVAMCIKKLPTRPTVTSLRDGIFHEFKKYGKVKSVVVRGDGADRHALVLFRTAAEANKAVSHAKSKLLFGAAIEATIYEGEVSGQELEECGGIIDEFHPRASRTLFVGNLDKTVSYSDIQNIFVRFGEIVAIEIKKQHNIPQYAFLQYTDIVSVVRAITKMDGEKLGRNPLKLGFGKTVVSSCLWVDGVTDSFTENYLASCFQRYGPVKHVVIDRNRGQALVVYAQYDFAQTAMAKMRARKLNGSRLKMDYASHELIDIFLKHMQSSGQSIQGLENIRQLLQPPLSPTGSMPTQNALSSSLSGPGTSSQHYSRSSASQDQRSYYDDHPPVNYSDIAPSQYASSESSYRRGWRGRSRERYAYPEQSAHGRHGKRAYEDTYERSDYHRERSPGWEHDAYSDRRASTVSTHYDQDYRQKDYDIRREQRGYGRKPVGGAAPYDEQYHYRGSRERPRDPDRGRDIERIRDRDRVGDGYYPRSSHMSPSNPRYLPRKSRSPSPHTSSRLRDVERTSLDERGGIDTPGLRRRGRSGTPSPELQADVLRNRRNSVESKSSSRSGSRYASRAGDVDMRENISPLLDSEKSRSSHAHGGDERVVELREKPSKSRVRSRVVVDSPSKHASDLSPKPTRRRGFKASDAGSDREATGRSKRDDESQEYDPGTWGAESPSYSEDRSRSGTPTRDENQDLIGEVIIKQPSVSSSVSKPVSRKAEGTWTKEEKKHYDQDRKESRGKLRDKDYRKGFNLEQIRKERKPETRDRDERPSGSKASRSNSSSLIQRVHSPPEVERKGSLTYTKDFDYRKHHSVRPSKSSGDVTQKHFASAKSSSYDQADVGERSRKQKIQSYARVAADDDKKSISPQSSLSPASQVARPRGSGSAKLIKREYSPSPQDEGASSAPFSHKSRKQPGERTKGDVERQRTGKERDYQPGQGSRDRDDRYTVARVSRDVDSKDIDERRLAPQKRRHSADARNAEGSPEVSTKRERKSSTGDYTKSKPSQHHQATVKHEAPMSIARQMFLQEEDESGTDSPLPQTVGGDLMDENADEIPMHEVVQVEECVSQSPSEDTQPIGDEDLINEEHPITQKQKSRWDKSDAEATTELKSEETTSPTPFPNVTLNAARSLLPKRLPKTSNVDIRATQMQIDKQKAKIKKEANEKGNLIDLEREKMRLQEMLSKLDSEKQLDVKEAEEVAGVVLHELTNKAKSKILAARPPKEEPKKVPKKPPAMEPGTSNEEVQKRPADDSAKDEGDEIPSNVEVESCEVEETTVEEEIVVDTIEEVTEDEVIETEVEDEAVGSEASQKDVSEPTPTPVLAPEIPEPVVKDIPPIAKTVEEIDHTQGYRKQMEARKREKDKEKERKKLLRKQEKEKKKQMKRVLAMRGPGQTVISSVDEEDDATVTSGEDKTEDVQEEMVQPHGKHPLSDQEEESERKRFRMDENAITDASVESTPVTDVKTEASMDVREASQEDGGDGTDQAAEVPRHEGTAKTSEVETETGSGSTNQETGAPGDLSEAKNHADEKRAADFQKLENLELEKPWPPDKNSTLAQPTDSSTKPTLKAEVEKEESVSDGSAAKKDDTQTDVVEQSQAGKAEPAPVRNPQATVAHTDVKKALSRSVSPITPSSTGQSTPIIATTPQVPSKEPTPSPGAVNNLQSLTPTGSLASSVSHKSSRTTPATTPSQTSKTPTFTTPSPASSSSTSSSKSQARQKASKTTPVMAHSSSHPGQQQKRSAQAVRQDHHSRSRSGHSASDHKRRPSQHHHRGQSSSSHSHKVKETSKAKPMQSFSRRPMTSITVGLDSSPSKPLGKNELERLKMELESVKSQLSLEMSPSSLSPCSGDENEGKSPAQLLSPVSPILRSPADPVHKKSDTIGASTVTPAAAGPSNTPSLTDRMKLLGRIKKRTPGQGTVVRTDEQIQNANQIKDKELEFKQSRMFRSSIFDQDSERLLHIQQQLEEERKQLELQQTAGLLPSSGPLFSGSRFLEQTPLTGTPLPVGSLPQANSLPVTGEVPPTIAELTPSAVNSSSQHSSTTGPKNVYSLSRCELPATAERIAHDDSGKNCNTTQAIVDSHTDMSTQALQSDTLYCVKAESATLAAPLQMADATVVAPPENAHEIVNHNKSGDNSAPSQSPPPSAVSVLQASDEKGDKVQEKHVESELVMEQTQGCDVVQQEATVLETAEAKNSEIAEVNAIQVEEPNMEADISAMTSSGDLMVSEEIVGEVVSGNAVVADESENMGGDTFYGADLEVVAHMDVYEGVSETVETSAEAEISVPNPDHIQTSVGGTDEMDHVEMEVTAADEKIVRDENIPVVNVVKESDVATPTEEKSEVLEDATYKVTSSKKEEGLKVSESGEKIEKKTSEPDTSQSKTNSIAAKKSDAKSTGASTGKSSLKTGKTETASEKKPKFSDKVKKEKPDSSKDKKKSGLLPKQGTSNTPKKHKSNPKDADSKNVSGTKKFPENPKVNTDKKSDSKKLDSMSVSKQPKDVKAKGDGPGTHTSKDTKGGSIVKKKIAKSHSEKKKFESTSKTGSKSSEKKSIATENETQKNPDEQPAKVAKLMPASQGPRPDESQDDVAESGQGKTEKESLPSSLKDAQPTKPQEMPTSSKSHKRDGSNSKERKLGKHPKKDKKQKSDKSAHETKHSNKSSSKKHKDSPTPQAKNTDKCVQDESSRPVAKDEPKPAEEPTNPSEPENLECHMQGAVEEMEMQLSDDASAAAKSVKTDEQRSKVQEASQAKKESKADSGNVKKKKKKKRHNLDKEGTTKAKITSEDLASDKTEEGKSIEIDKKEKVQQKMEKAKKLKSSSGKSKKPSEVEKQSSSTSKYNNPKKIEASEGKAVKKSSISSLKKESKKHGNLKPSHSLPADAKTKDKPPKHKPEKTSTHKKVDKSSSAATSSSQQSRYSMIYDSSSSESGGDTGPPPPKKSAMKKGTVIEEVLSPDSQKKDEDDSVWHDEEPEQKTTLTTVWSDLDDGVADSHSRSRISSSLSSSSMSDSAGPPPVVTSSCLVTETIKSETILPPGYDEEEFSSSFYKMDEGKQKEPESVVPSKTGRDSSKDAKSMKKKKKKLIVSQSPPFSSGKKKKHRESSKHSGRRLIMSSSDDSESADDQQVFPVDSSSSDFGLSDGESAAAFNSKPSKKPAASKELTPVTSKTVASVFMDFSDSESEEEIFPSRSNESTPKADAAPKAEKKPDVKTPSKSAESQKSKKTHGSSKSKEKSDSKTKNLTKTHDKKDKQKIKSNNASKPVSNPGKESGSVTSQGKGPAHTDKATKNLSHSGKESGVGSSQDKGSNQTEKATKKKDEHAGGEQPKSFSKDREKQDKAPLSGHHEKEIVKQEKSHQAKTKKEGVHKSHKHSSKISDARPKPASSDSKPAKEVSDKSQERPGPSPQEQKKPKPNEAESAPQQPTEGSSSTKPKEKHKSGKHQEKENPLCHGKKKKLKKKAKTDKHEKKQTPEKNVQPPAIPVEKQTSKQPKLHAKPIEVKPAELRAHSIFDSESDDSDAVGHEKASRTSDSLSGKRTQPQHAEKGPEQSDDRPPENLDGAKGDFDEKSTKPSARSPSMCGRPKFEERGYKASPKHTEKRRGSAESFLTTSTTDDSDVEQRIAVQSALSTLDKDTDIVDEPRDDMFIKEEPGNLEIVEEDFPPPFVNIGGQKSDLRTTNEPSEAKHLEEDADKMKREASPFKLDQEGTPSPAKKSVKSPIKSGSSDKTKKPGTKREKGDDKKPKHGKKNTDRWKSSRYRSHEHGIYGEKKRREDMERMKSLSHERDEEAVRSIVGILDESSDADSYFSDVRSEAEAHTSAALGKQTPEADTTKRRSVDSDSMSLSGATPFRAAENVTNPEVDVKVEKESDPEGGDVSDSRTTAEEKELAAAVSSIEGLFGDFDQKPPPDDFQPPLPGMSYNDHKEHKESNLHDDSTSCADDRPAGPDEVEVRSQEEIERGSTEAALAATALLESTEDEDPFFGYQPTPSQATITKTSVPIGTSLTDSEANETDSGAHAFSSDDSKRPDDSLAAEGREVADIELPSIRTDLPASENADPASAAVLPPSASSTAGRKRQRQSRGASSSRRSSSRESKSDWSVSDASMSESEPAMQETSKTAHRKPKAAKVCRLDGPTASAAQTSDSYDFDSDIKTQTLSLPKPDTAEATLPFVSATCAPFYPLPKSTASVSEATVEKIATSRAETTTMAPTQTVMASHPPTDPQRPSLPARHGRRLSSDVDGISPVGVASKRRSSSSSSSAAHSPSRGSHLSQLTPPLTHLITPPAPHSGMHMPGPSSVGVISYSHHTAPFVSQNNVSLVTANPPKVSPQRMPSQLPTPVRHPQGVPPDSPAGLRHVSPRAYQSSGQPPHILTAPRSEQPYAMNFPGMPRHPMASHPQGFPPQHPMYATRPPSSQPVISLESRPTAVAPSLSMPSKAPNQFSVASHGKPPGLPVPYAAVPPEQSGVLHHTNPQSMPTHHASAAPTFSGAGTAKPAGMQPGNDKDAGSIPPLASSVPPAASSLTSPTLRQHHFAYAHQPPASQAPVRMQTTTQHMHHIGVPTYPHHQAPVKPQAMVIPVQHRPVHQEMPGVRPTAGQPASSLPRPNFTQPHTHVGHAVHQPHPHYPQKQLPPAPFQQQPQRQVLASPGHPPNVPPGAQVSPSARLPGIPPGVQEQERHATIQRTPSNPYLQHMTTGQPVQTPPRPTPLSQNVTPVAGIPVRPIVQTKAEKSEPQRMPAPQGGNPSTMPTTHVSPQAGSHNQAHKKPEPGQTRMLHPVQQQQVFPHPALYYQPGLMHPMHGAFPPGIPGYNPGLQYLPSSVITPQGFLPGQAGLPRGPIMRPPTPQQQMEELEKQAQQQRMQVPHQKLEAEKEHRQHQQGGLHTPGRKDAQTPTSTIASPMAQNVPRTAPHPVRPAETGLRPQAHQMYMPPSEVSSGHSQRPPHGDRVVRAQTDLSQEDMVAQHFRKSGFMVPASSSSKPQLSTSSAPSQSPGSAQDRQNQSGQIHGERTPEVGTMHPAFHHAVSPRPAAKQDHLNVRPQFPLAASMYPGPAFTQQPPHLFHGFPLPGGARYPGVPDPNMWPRQNFRPPPVSMSLTQPYLRGAAPPHSNMSMTQTRPLTPASSAPALQVQQPARSPSTPKSSDSSDPVMDLFQRYPVIWQGLLALKNDSAAVQTHFICGDLGLAQACLPKPDTQQTETDEERNLAVLRIVQRMRLEPLQLEGVDKRMVNSDFCLLLALPCGRDKTDVIRQQNALKQGFIDYLKQKQAAGIVNVQGRQMQDQVQYVLHVFPPCDFTTKHLQRHAQDLLSNINDIQHIMIVIAPCK